MGELDEWDAGEPVRVHDRARRLMLAVIQSAVPIAWAADLLAH
ncbi:MAG: hypothetical protein QOE86_2340, partial [Solirubrobacteraceae bacterium]|nr:hypothetical protein [Solirubrobacteraceae bacterium]